MSKPFITSNASTGEASLASPDDSKDPNVNRTDSHELGKH